MAACPRTSIVVALALALGGCGEDRGSAATTVPQPLAGAITTTPGSTIASAAVSLTEFRLPPDPRIIESGTIAFAATNDGELRHALAVDGPAGEVRTPALAPGERATIAVALPRGTYRWYCPIDDHEQRGMVGRVRVQE